MTFQGAPEVKEVGIKIAALQEHINRSFAGNHDEFSGRARLLSGYVSVAQQHHDAIMVLINFNLIGSAFALMRPLMETGTRGTWAFYKATDEQWFKIANNKFKFKSMGEMLDDLELVHDAGGLFSSLKNEWNLLCGLTHGGMEQVSRRVSPEGIVQRYKLEEIIGAMEYATGIWVLFALSFLTVMGKGQERVEIWSLYRTIFAKPNGTPD